MKNEIEKQLKISEEHVKTMESTCTDKDQLAMELNTIRKDLENKSSTCENLLQDTLALKKQLQTKDEENQATCGILKKEKEDLAKEVESVSEKLKHEIEEKSVLKKEYNELQKSYEVSVTLNEAKNANEHETLTSKIEQLVRENQNKEEKVKGLEQQCEQFQKREFDLNEKMTNSENTMKNIIEKLKNINNISKDGQNVPIIAETDIEASIENVCSYLTGKKIRKIFLFNVFIDIPA